MRRVRVADETDGALQVLVPQMRLPAHLQRRDLIFPVGFYSVPSLAQREKGQAHSGLCVPSPDGRALPASGNIPFFEPEKSLLYPHGCYTLVWVTGGRGIKTV